MNESYETQAITLGESALITQFSTGYMPLMTIASHSGSPIVTVVPGGPTGVLVGRLERGKLNLQLRLFCSVTKYIKR